MLFFFPIIPCSLSDFDYVVNERKDGFNFTRRENSYFRNNKKKS